MPSKGPVKIVWQIIFIFIPIVDLWAFYRIKKLRKFLLMVWIPETVITTVIVIFIYGLIVAAAVFGGPNILNDQTPSGKAVNDELTKNSIILYIVETGFTILSIYLIYKWSKEWNKQFPSSGNVNP